MIARARAAWRSIPLLPAVLAAFPILALYSASGVSAMAVVRAVGVAVGGGLAVWAASSAGLGDRNKGALAAVLITLALFIGPRLSVLAGIGVLLIAVLVVLPRVLKVGFPWPLMMPASNALAIAILFVVASRGALSGTFAQLPRDLADGLLGRPGPPAAESSGLPDIYLIMLEDYPRADTLDRLFGFDNKDFLSALEDRGFTVAATSRSNYSNSQLTLLTMFQARHIEAIPELDELRRHASSQQYPLLRVLTNGGVVFGLLRNAGYTVIATTSGFEQLGLRSADRFFDSGQLNDFEVAALRETALASLGDAVFPDYLGDQQRARIRADLAFPAAVLRDKMSGPRFVFVHVPSPHAPVVFGAHGEPVRASLSDPNVYDTTDRARFSDSYVGQLEYLNRLVLTAIDAISRDPRPAVTIVMSDEGFGGVVDPDPDMVPVDSVANLFAARAPNGESLFAESETPVNVFPILLDRYLGTGLPKQPDRNFISNSATPFDGHDIPNTDAPSAT